MNINSFLPIKKKLHTWRDRKKLINEPLFPSYVFIYLNDMRNYYEGLHSDGSLYYVKTGKEIARVSESVVNNIKLAVNEAAQMELSDRHFTPGRCLVITKGALAGLSCEVVQFENKDKLLVRVDLLQRNILLTLPEEHLMAV